MARGSNLTGFSWRQRPLKVCFVHSSTIVIVSDLGRERSFAPRLSPMILAGIWYSSAHWSDRHTQRRFIGLRWNAPLSKPYCHQNNTRRNIVPLISMIIQEIFKIKRSNAM